MTWTPQSKALVALGLIVASAVLTGCASVGSTTWSWSRLSRQCEADGRAVWLDADQHIDNLLVLGGVKDPNTTRGAIVPDDPYGYEGEERLWFEWAGLKTVFVYMRPATEPPGPRNTYKFGPYKGEPQGVYEWDRLPISDPRCAAYLTWWDARHAHFEGTPVQGIGPPRDDCVSYSYRGPLKLSDYAYVYLWWHDASVLGSGASRTVYEIRKGVSQPIARAVHYQGNDPLVRAPECFHRSEVPDFWFRSHSARRSASHP